MRSTELIRQTVPVFVVVGLLAGLGYWVNHSRAVVGSELPQAAQRRAIPEDVAVQPSTDGEDVSAWTKNATTGVGPGHLDRNPWLSEGEFEASQALLRSLRTRSDLAEYRLERHAVLHSGTGGEGEVFATVTFVKPLRFEEVREFVDGVQPTVLRYRSHPDGGGVIPYGANGADVERKLQRLEERVAEQMRELNGVDDFAIVDGYLAARVLGRPAVLRELSHQENVYLVDVEGTGSVNVDVYAVLQTTGAYKTGEN